MKPRNMLIGMLVVVVAVLIPATAGAMSGPAHVRPDDRAGVRGAGAVVGKAGSSAVRPDDRVGIHGPGTSPPTSLVRSSDGFDWRDAFVGGLGGVGIALLLTGLLFLVTSRRTRTRIA